MPFIYQESLTSINNRFLVFDINKQAVVDMMIINPPDKKYKFMFED